jgi:hypothetical protein
MVKPSLVHEKKYYLFNVEGGGQVTPASLLLSPLRLQLLFGFSVAAASVWKET